MRKYEFTLSRQAEQIAMKAERSAGGSLWQGTNKVIAKVLFVGVMGHHSRKRIADRLKRIAGPREKGEMTCISNIRAAARCVEEGSSMDCLV